jgi:hypothetical protein
MNEFNLTTAPSVGRNGTQRTWLEMWPLACVYHLLLSSENNLFILVQAVLVLPIVRIQRSWTLPGFEVVEYLQWCSP